MGMIVDPYRFAVDAGNRFNSQYEAHTALSGKSKLRMLDTFQGSTYDTNRWDIYDIVGSSGSATIEDGAGNGLAFTPGATNGDASTLLFDLIRPITPRSCKVITVGKASSRSTQDFYMGTTNERTFGKNYQLWGIRKATSTTKWAMLCYGTAAEGFTSTASSSNSNTNWNTHEMIGGASNCVGKVNGTTEVTITTDLTALDQTPCLECGNNGAGSMYNRNRWFEVYNI